VSSSISHELTFRTTTTWRRLEFVPVQSSRRSPVQPVPTLRMTLPVVSSTTWATLVVRPT
jgi:hypothetical protein